MKPFPLLIILVLLSYRSFSQNETFSPSRIAKPVYFDVSPPLRDMAARAPAKADQTWKDGIVRNIFRDQNRDYFAPGYIDPVRQYSPGQVLTDTTLQNFEGVGNLNGVLPPDTYGDVGPNHYFQVVNLSYAIYNKSGALLLGPVANSTVFTGLPNNSNDGDAVVMYDEQANRWLFSQFSLPNYPNSPFYQMIAVSTTPDPTGTWYRWEYTFSDMNDYPKFGVWPDGYYMTCNRFASGSGNYAGTGAAAFDRTAMLAGNGSPTMIYFTLPSSNEAYSMLPSDCDGPFPAAGTPDYFAYIRTSSPYHLGIYEFHANWTTPASSTFGNFVSLAVNTFSASLSGIPQKGTNVQVDPITDRLMYRLQYRKFGNHQSMVTNHTVNAGSSVAGVRWYELRNTGSGWTLYQQSTYAPDNTCRWMGSVAMDSSGNMALGYSVSSSTVYPSIRYTGRFTCDPQGTMSVTEKGIINGGGCQTYATAPRWGDYSGMTVDPSSPSTFWYTQEYYPTTSQAGWHTRVASFFLGMTAGFAADNTSPPTGTTVTFTDQSIGCPASWTWTFSPNTVTFVNGTSGASQNPKVQFNTGGQYSVTLSVSNAAGSATLTKTNYIHAGTNGLWTGITSSDWNTASNWNDFLLPLPTSTISVPSTAPFWPVYTGSLTVGSQCQNLTLSGSGQLSVNGSLTINPGYSVTMSGSPVLKVAGDWTDYGRFNAGTGTVQFTGSGPSTITGGINPGIYVPNYSLATFSQGMTVLSGGSAGPSGNDKSSVLNIGFTFNYLGVSYTQLTMCTNGWLSMNQTGGTTTDNTLLYTTGAPNTTLAPWFDDLKDDASSSCNYKTEGSAPNRVFTAEWNNLLTYTTGATARISFQVKLYETTNVIEFQYGNVSAGTHSASESASIGIEDATGGSGHFIDATTGSFTTGVTTLVSTTNWPVVDYRFTPPPSAKETFFNLTNAKNNANLTIQPDIIINGNLIFNP